MRGRRRVARSPTTSAAKPRCGSSAPRPGTNPINPDFLDLLRALHDAGVRFLVVGAQAMAAHGVPRATGDMDVWVEPTQANAQLVWRALLAFGAPVEAFDLSVEDFAVGGNVVQIGVPPRRIDLMTSIDGVEFTAAWESRLVTRIADCPVPFLAREELLRNKRAAGRPKDLLDIELLEGSAEDPGDSSSDT